MSFKNSVEKILDEIISTLQIKETWDVFISHASEDKQEIATPLKERLEKEGIRVWYDNSELTPGDDLVKKINTGLRNSRFGIIVLSPYFFHKKWTMDEANALFITKGERIIPIWHHLTSEHIQKISPLLAGKLAISTEDGLDHVVQKILTTVKPTKVDKSLQEQKPSIAQTDKEDKKNMETQQQPSQPLPPILSTNTNQQQRLYKHPLRFFYRAYGCFGLIMLLFISFWGLLKLYELIINDVYKKPFFLDTILARNIDYQILEAVKNGNSNKVKVLLKKGASPNVRYGREWENKMTVLMYASYQGFSGTVKALLNGGADTNLWGRTSYNPYSEDEETTALI